MDNQTINDFRTEEVQHIIDRMPSKFGFFVSIIATLLVVLLFSFGWIVKYPDVVPGKININMGTAPVKLISNSNGKLHLLIKETGETIEEGKMLAYIENPTNFEDCQKIKFLLLNFNGSEDEIERLATKLPENVSLGELNVKYFAFLNNIREFMNYSKDRLLSEQIIGVKKLLIEQRNGLEVLYKRLEMAKNTTRYIRKFYLRDSTLFARKVISEYELDKTQLNYISSRDAQQNINNNILNAKQGIEQSESRLIELQIQDPEKGKELRQGVNSSFNDLIDNIKNWEQKFVFKAPFDGKIQFLKFYNNQQFISSGEQVFAIVPKHQKPFGEVVLPTQGSGKVKVGQQVIVKLDNFPYAEYGSIRGKVRSISLVTSNVKTEKADIETYLLFLDFPDHFRTNYGTTLSFSADTKGTAEVITDDRRLIMRLFDNLKYHTNN